MSRQQFDDSMVRAKLVACSCSTQTSQYIRTPTSVVHYHSIPKKHLMIKNPFMFSPLVNCLQETNDSAAEVFFTRSQLSCRCWGTPASCTIEALCSWCSLQFGYRCSRWDSSVSCRCSTPPAEKTERGRHVTLSTGGGRNNQGLAACYSVITIIQTWVRYQSYCLNRFKKTNESISQKWWTIPLKDEVITVDHTLGDGQQPHVVADSLQQVSPSGQLVVSSHLTSLSWGWCSSRYTGVIGTESSCRVTSFWQEFAAMLQV